MDEKFYYLKDLEKYGCRSNEGVDYLLEDDKWVIDRENEVLTRTAGTNKSESLDSPYRHANRSIMDNIQELSEEDFNRKTGTNPYELEFEEE